MAISESFRCDCGKFFQNPFDFALHRHIWHDGGAVEPFAFPGVPSALAGTARTLSPILPLNAQRNILRNARLKTLTFEGDETVFKSSDGKVLDIVVDEFSDIWLRNDKGNLRKICAAKARSGDFLCCNAAGFETSHLGIGHCKYHDAGDGLSAMSDPSRTKLSTFLLPHLLQEGHSLHQSLQRIANISNKELFDIETPLRTAYVLLDQQLIEGGVVYKCPECGGEIKGELSHKDIQEILKTLRMIDRLIRSDADIRAKLIVDPIGIWTFVSGIMEIAMNYIPKAERAEFAESVLQKVVMPLGDNSKLVLNDIEDVKPDYAVLKK